MNDWSYERETGYEEHKLSSDDQVKEFWTSLQPRTEIMGQIASSE